MTTTTKVLIIIAWACLITSVACAITGHLDIGVTAWFSWIACVVINKIHERKVARLTHS